MPRKPSPQRPHRGARRAERPGSSSEFTTRRLLAAVTGVPGADLKGRFVIARLAGLLELSGSAWLRRRPPTTTRRCSSVQETSGLGRRARNVAVDARNSSGVYSENVE